MRKSLFLLRKKPLTLIVFRACLHPQPPQVVVLVIQPDKFNHKKVSNYTAVMNYVKLILTKI